MYSTDSKGRNFQLLGGGGARTPQDERPAADAAHKPAAKPDDFDDDIPF